MDATSYPGQGVERQLDLSREGPPQGRARFHALHSKRES